MGPSITRIVRYILKGEPADSHLITAVSGSAYTADGGGYTAGTRATVSFDGKVIFSATSMGLYLLVVGASDGRVIFSKGYDTFTNVAAQSSLLVSALKTYQGTQKAVVILVSQDAISITSDVVDALRYYGGGNIQTLNPQRAAIAFIGQAEMPEGRAYYEVQEGEKKTIKISASTANGALIMGGSNGDKGEQGATLRGPQAWSDCAIGYKFESGAKGEEWKDVVLYGNNYYSCIKSHVKTANNYPSSTESNNNGYWKLSDKIELVATKILLATYALVKNLGVEAIEMKDDAGNVLFEAKDGNVTCKTGTFDNVNIQSGKISGFTIKDGKLTNNTDNELIRISNSSYTTTIGGKAYALYVSGGQSLDSFFGIYAAAGMYLAQDNLFVVDGQIQQRHTNVSTGENITLSQEHDGMVVSGNGTLYIGIGATNYLNVRFFVTNECTIVFQGLGYTTVHKDDKVGRSLTIKIGWASMVNVFCKNSDAYIKIIQ